MKRDSAERARECKTRFVEDTVASMKQTKKLFYLTYAEIWGKKKKTHRQSNQGATKERTLMIDKRREVIAQICLGSACEEFGLNRCNISIYSDSWYFIVSLTRSSQFCMLAKR